MQKEINVNLPYEFNENEQKISNYQVTINYLVTAVSSNDKKLKGQMKRLFGRLVKKIKEAKKKGEDTIKLETNEYEFIEKSVADCEIHPVLAENFLILEDAINDAKDVE